MSAGGLAIALVLPWVLGVLWLRALLLRSGRYNLAVLLGQGYFLGIFATTLLVRLWDAVGLSLAFMPLAAALSVLAIMALPLQRGPSPPVASDTSPLWNVWTLLGAAILLALIGWRYVTLLQELLLRPLYAWDAWMNWVPRSIIWYDRAELVEFVHPRRWEAAGNPDLYTIGNRQAWNYPVSVSIIPLWSMLGAGTTDHGALFLPWLMAPLAIALALFGHLRLAGVAPLPALAASYLLLSMPYVNVHSVLAGYADIWLAGAFTMGVFGLFEWRCHRHWSSALLVVVGALFCAQLKVPGLFLGAILVVVLARSMLNLKPRQELWLLAGLAALLLLAMTMELSLELPYLGRFRLGWDTMEVGRIGAFKLAIHPVGGVFAETLLEMINWHLLGYLLPPLLVLYLWRYRTAALPPSEVLATALGIVFIVSIFLFTGYYQQAVNYVAINRAMLYPVPALIFICFLAWRRRTEGEGRC